MKRWSSLRQKELPELLDAARAAKRANRREIRIGQLCIAAGSIGVTNYERVTTGIPVQDAIMASAFTLGALVYTEYCLNTINDEIDLGVSNHTVPDQKDKNA